MSLLLPIIGGILIGLSTILMLLGLGRITGVSGIIGSTLTSFKAENFWRYFFILGLGLGMIPFYLFESNLLTYSVERNTLLVIIAGLLVGYGTRLGSGCTSGHGVCGIPRFSQRSVLATFVFIVSGILTVFFKGYFSWIF